MGDFLGRRSFTRADQEKFAELSGDYNPMHIDPLASRRMLFGGQVVHGVHLALWALDRCLGAGQETRRLKRLKITFNHPLLVGDEVSASGECDDRGTITLHIASAGKTLAKIDAEISGNARTDNNIPSMPASQELKDLSAGDLANLRGSVPLYFDRDIAGSLFENITGKFPDGQLAVILATTRLVGMECPGRRSVFSGLELTFGESTVSADALSWEVSRVDDRFSLVWIKVSGAWANGVIKAFVRPEPASQPGFDEVKELVKPNRFKGQRALIIGGSRGLGEVTAKIIAAGGGEVALTYSMGKQDAQKTVDEIGEPARAVKYEVGADNNELAGLLANGFMPTHLYYFASPFISGGVKNSFSSEKFNGFCEFYVKGFYDTVTQVSNAAANPLSVFFPSTVFVDETPGNMAEYACAKAAGETLCGVMSKTIPNVNIHIARLPKTKTDQTVSFMPSIAANSLGVMLEALGEMENAERTAIDASA